MPESLILLWNMTTLDHDFAGLHSRGWKLLLQHKGWISCRVHGCSAEEGSQISVLITILLHIPSKRQWFYATWLLKEHFCRTLHCASSPGAGLCIAAWIMWESWMQSNALTRLKSFWQHRQLQLWAAVVTADISRCIFTVPFKYTLWGSCDKTILVFHHNNFFLPFPS